MAEMDNLNEMIMDVLNNQEKMQQVMQMASALGLTTENQPQPDGEKIHRLAEKAAGMIEQTERQDQRQEKVFRAIMPYLTPAKQSRLERALQISQLSRFANLGLQDLLPTRGVRKEEPEHV